VSSQIAVLQEELVRCLRQQNFTSTLCLAFEGGARQKTLQAGSKLPDDTLGNVCKLLKLSPLQSAAFAFALTQSQHRALALDAQKALKARLAEVAAGASFAEVHDDGLHGLAVAVASSEVRSKPSQPPSHSHVPTHPTPAPSIVRHGARALPLSLSAPLCTSHQRPPQTHTAPSPLHALCRNWRPRRYPDTS